MFIKAGVIDGKVILSSGGFFLMEVGGRDGAASRDIAAIGAVRRESVPSPSCWRPPALVVSSAVGLSRCSTPMDPERRRSGGVDDGGGVGRIDTLCAEGAR